MYPESPYQFRASNGWLVRFVSRNKLSCSTVTSQGQKVPSNASDLAKEFLQYTHHHIKSKDFQPSFIANMDETPVWFDLPSSRSYDFRGVKYVPAKTTGKEKLRYTVVLAAMADGKKLPTMVIFKVLKNPKRNISNRYRSSSESLCVSNVICFAKLNTIEGHSKETEKQHTRVLVTQNFN